ncbi:wd40 repeat protein [Anaeramoeba flamelloides]|uniref:Wd40 repeat protein n=1 Tax=Anaeramoeba flamelloides TaxID=1746091 RepID=A0AAV7ZIT5_9EUKA|nr:wd40 repeat protein [Anaeramoeba flamelloides]KAJ6235653.1 wd40 repeat protein [Anaeramoeba flamelloides]
MTNLPSKCVQLLEGHKGPVYVVKFTHGGKYCLSCSSDKTIKLWNPYLGAHIKTYVGHGYGITDIDVSLDNSKIFSCGGGNSVFMWDVTRGKIFRKFSEHELKVDTLCLNNESSILLTGSFDKTVKCWDLKSRSYSSIQTLTGFTDTVTSISTTDYEIICGSVDGHIRIFDLRVGKMFDDNINFSISNVSLSNDNKCILASCLNSKHYLINKTNGDLLNTYQGHKNQDYRLSSCLTYDDSHVVSCSEDGKLYFWDLVGSKVAKTLNLGTSTLCGLSYHPSKHILLTSSVNGKIYVMQ